MTETKVTLTTIDNPFDHHINPLTVEDILNRSSKVFDPENVICTCLNTHQAIHFGDETILNLGPIERKKNDTCPWRHE